MEQFLDVVKNKYAQFDGRARRQEYWMFVLISILIQLVGYAIIGMGVAMESGALISVGYVALMVLGLGLLIPSLAVAVRRLHDVNKSGWLLLIALIPIVGGIILFIWLFTEGTRGPNQYGPDPKGNNELKDIGKQDFV